jgi:hypothetical protein
MSVPVPLVFTTASSANCRLKIFRKNGTCAEHAQMGFSCYYSPNNVVSQLFA